MAKRKFQYVAADLPHDAKGDPVVNRCKVCGGIASHGYDFSWLAHRKMGNWYCFDHRPDKPTTAYDLEI